MKRTALLRKTALRRSKFMAKSKQTKRALRSGDPVYLDWIRSLPCSACSRKPPSHPHHSTGGGMGTKSSDRESMPLCFQCHREFHDGRGWAEYMSRHDRRIWQTYQAERCRQLYDSLGVPHQLAQAR